MNISIIIVALGALILFSHVFNALFDKTKVPNVLLLMLIGIVVGPIAGLAKPEDLGIAGKVFTTVTLICVLFESGSRLNFDSLKQSLGSSILLTLANFFAMLAICGLCGRLLLGLDWLHSFYLGAVLGGTSSAVVIPMLSQLKPGDKANTILLLESSLSDVICLATGLAIFSGIQTGEVDFSQSAKEFGLSITLAIILGTLIGAGWLIFLKKVLKDMKNSIFTSFALAFIIYGLCELININGGIAILCYGIALGNTDRIKRVRVMVRLTEDRIGLNKEERDFFSEIVFVLQTYFFVYIGLSIQFNNVWHLAAGLLIVFLCYAGRYCTGSMIRSKEVCRRDHRLIATLGPKGLIGAVLATMPLDAAVSEVEIKQGITVRNVAYAVVFFSILASSIMVIVGEFRRSKEEAPESASEPEAASHSEGTGSQQQEQFSEGNSQPEA